MIHFKIVRGGGVGESRAGQHNKKKGNYKNIEKFKLSKPEITGNCLLDFLDFDRLKYHYAISLYQWISETGLIKYIFSSCSACNFSKLDTEKNIFAVILNSNGCFLN